MTRYEQIKADSHKEAKLRSKFCDLTHQKENTMETEMIDKLFLELSQFTKAKTRHEIELESRCMESERKLAPCGDAPLPDFLATHVENWLESNRKSPSQVRHGMFPIGMVQRWIERAEKAENELQRKADGIQPVVLL